MLLIADSQGKIKYLEYKLDKVMGSSFTVFGHAHPGALLSKLVEPLTNNLNLMPYDDKDWIIIVGGCNNLSDINKDINVELYSGELVSALKTQINKSTAVNILIYRHDLHTGDHRKDAVAKVNEEIKTLVQKILMLMY